MDDQLWKCPKHPSKRRRTGICPTCLYDRLIILCTDCGNVRPCGCCANSTTSFSSSSCSGGVVDYCVSNFMESEPSFQRSRSTAIPLFLPSRFGSAREAVDVKLPASGSQTRSWLWSVFRTSDKSKKLGERVNEELNSDIFSSGDDFEGRMMMMRSRSVSVQIAGAAAKGRGWHFPSPIKVFRQSKVSNRVHQRSP